MDPEQHVSDDPNTIAGLKADKRTDLQFDFELEDLIAGNSPGTDIGRSIAGIVGDMQGLPTQGKIEAALLPLYETMLADIFLQEGGSGLPPLPNRHNIRQHAAKVIQVRKIKRTALARASRPATKARNSNYTPWPQLLMIAGLLIVIAAVLYFRS